VLSEEEIIYKKGGDEVTFFKVRLREMNFVLHFMRNEFRVTFYAK